MFECTCLKLGIMSLTIVIIMISRIIFALNYRKDEQIVRLHPSTILSHYPVWVTYYEFVLTSQHYIRTVTAIEPEWLLELSSEYYDLARMPNGDIKRDLERTKITLLKMF